MGGTVKDLSGLDFIGTGLEVPSMPGIVTTGAKSRRQLSA